MLGLRIQEAFEVKNFWLIKYKNTSIVEIYIT